MSDSPIDSPRLAPFSLDLDPEGARRTVLRATRIGLVAWPSFIFLDAYMCFVAYPGAPFFLFLAYRVVVEAVLLAVLRAANDPDVRVGPLKLFLLFAYALAAFTIALMTIHLGTIRSPYMHGISIVALVRATVLPEPWRRAAPNYAAIALAFPAVMGGAALLVPGVQTAWADPQQVTVFVSNYVFVLSSCIVGMIAGHLVWAAREQVYRARRVGRYRLQAPIGKGGMGEVWLARDLTLQRNVALKLLRMGESASPEAVKRFEREARAASRLRHPHVVQIFDFGASDDGLYYIAMEYLTGTDLDSLVSEFGPLPPARAIHFITQACHALEAAHAHGVIHRDLKPHNLFITQVSTDPDFLKLLDFGIARFQAGEGEEHLTWTGVLVGTPAYLAPELWRGAPADERSDLYALGVTLYYLVTGTTPFAGATPLELHAAQIDLDPALPSERRGAVIPAALDAVILHCLARQPEDRVQSAHELRLALEAIRDPVGWTRADAEAFWRAVGPPATHRFTA